jgi:ABC-type sugar transport system ATPase subunit
MRVEIAKLHRNLGATMVYVTHDQVEAMTLADRIVVLRAGLVEQIGTPTELYDRPANTFVAGFIGSPKMNFLAATVEGVDGGALTLSHPAFAGGRLVVSSAAASRVKTGETLIVGMRPEHLTLDAANPVLTLALDISENLGGSTQLYTTGGGEPVTLVVPGRPDLQSGDALNVGIAANHIYLFDAAGQALRTQV